MVGNQGGRMKDCPNCLWNKNQPGRINKATLEGLTHYIPDMWFAGFCRGTRTIFNAIAWWAYQCDLAGQRERRAQDDD